MTREDILAMPAGRELDALVAEKVLDFALMHEVVQPEGENWFTYHHNMGYYRYSSNISAAWEVVEKFSTYRMQKLRDNDHRLVDGKAHQCFLNKNGNCAYGHTATEAICKAALIAKMEDPL
jgi:hypothetical protein